MLLTPLRMPAIATASCLFAMAIAPAQAGTSPIAAERANPYRLEPFHADFPVALSWPPQRGLEYERSRRQMLRQVAANLQGNVRRESWLFATEFFWNAPDDAVEPLIEAMDRAMGNPALADVVKNCVEAMGKMQRAEFEGPLRRALQHHNEMVRYAAYAALALCGRVETLRALAADFPRMDGRSRGAWLRAVRIRLGAEGIPVLRDCMMGPYPTAVRDQVLKEALQLDPAAAAEVLRGRWPEAVEEFKAVLAGVLHAAGDTAGTAWLHAALASEDVQTLSYAIRHCAFGDIGELREPLLRTTTHQRPEVRFEAARVLCQIAGEDVADVFEVLAAPDEAWETRAIALRELTQRGRPATVSVLLDELPTATGTRLQAILNMLSASGDPRGVPVLSSRFERAPEGERRLFLQALAQNNSGPAVDALCRLFAGPERRIAPSGDGWLTTRNYLPTLLLNARGQETTVLAAFAALPATDYAARAALLPTLVGIAADRTDPELRSACIEPVRALLFDRAELPQLRVLALNLLATRWLTIDDALRLKNGRQDESPGLRALFSDFLHDCF